VSEVIKYRPWMLPSQATSALQCAVQTLKADSNDPRVVAMATRMHRAIQADCSRPEPAVGRPAGNWEWDGTGWVNLDWKETPCPK